MLTSAVFLVLSVSFLTVNSIRTPSTRNGRAGMATGGTSMAAILSKSIDLGLQDVDGLHVRGDVVAPDHLELAPGIGEEHLARREAAPGELADQLVVRHDADALDQGVGIQVPEVH